MCVRDGESRDIFTAKIRRLTQQTVRVIRRRRTQKELKTNGGLSNKMASMMPLLKTEPGRIAELFKGVRARTMQIVAPLEIEDYVIQMAEFMSPPRWHVGHTSWFFETVLQAYKSGYKVCCEDYLFYFNSYYEGFGPRMERAKRGTRSRPTVRETLAYRKRIDELMLEFLDSLPDHGNAETVLSLVRLGLEHEMQHQELLVYDIKHLLCDQFAAPLQPAPASSVKVEGMAEIEGGLFWLGYAGWGSSPTAREGSLTHASAPNYDFA